MALTAPEQGPEEEQLQRALKDLPSELAVSVRSLAHAWTAAGGNIQVGRYTIRLLAPGSRGGAPLTAGFVHMGQGPDKGPALELCRARLVGHGVSAPDWVHWASELLDLQAHGFDPSNKYPRIELDPPLPAAEMALLVVGLRDLARMIH